ncbi:ATP-grasp fold amidoligase family protein [uncultured Parabacteroides sp.]|uniref:ATP-grasp fold amidoligase family protein n=1 Tax=uncultured Parabacteroides sp. TaxID=512312 RepID=UPI002638D773|nr:ATP-grasp fold amidoligase family protein [uncultured Parabacteroides sp.]
MNYKRIFRNQQLRFMILRLLQFVPDRFMLSMQYYIKMGCWLDFNKPKRFTEKLQLYKMKYRDERLCRCVDKYEVRKYVESKGLSDILNICYGVYDRAEDIELNGLPNQFVAKTTNGGGGQNVIIVRDKNHLDEKDFKQKLNVWLKGRLDACGREWAYSGIEYPKIVIEELLVDERNEDGSIEDYKFFCFNGKVCCIQEDTGRYGLHKRNLYTKKWELLDVICTYPSVSVSPKPINFEEMIQIAEILGKDFPFVRVDLYNIHGKIYFGELTFYPGSGYEGYKPDSFDFELGKYFTEY